MGTRDTDREHIMQYSGPTLHRYYDGSIIRHASEGELAASIEAAEHDGGAGVIEVDGVDCYAIG